MNYRNTFSKIVSTLIVVAASFFIYRKVLNHPDFFGSLAFIGTKLFSSSRIAYTLLLISLMPLNWLVESIKWRKLVLPLQKLSSFASFASVLSGATISLFTPNRTGEFAGRVLHLHQGNRIKGSLASILGSMSQLTVTIVIGSFCMLGELTRLFEEGSSMHAIAHFILPIVALIALWIYFNLSGFHRLISKYHFLNSISSYFEVLGAFDFILISKLLLLSLLRYLIFTIQFLLAFYACGVDVPALETLQLIPVIYLVMALIPGFAITEFTFRGSVTLYFLTSLTPDVAGVLAASSLIWFVNLVLPALAGSFFMTQARLLE